MVSTTNLIVGLTGGMGCGKSTAAAMFADCGFRTLDADRVVREEILTDPEVVDAIKGKLGPSMLDAAGKVSRHRLAAIVFSDPPSLAWLEELTHPRLLARWRELFARSEGTAFLAEVPLLFEKGLENWFDFIICVTTDSTSQLRRLEQRGIPPELAHQRLAKQMPLARKCELADYVLLNDGSTDFLREQVDALAGRLLKSQSDRLNRPIHGSPP